MRTTQDKMKTVLAKAGIPSKKIDCYGNQIVITSFSRDAAERWANLLGHFAKVRGIVESADEAVENKGTSLRPTMVRVFHTFACVGGEA